MASRAGGELGPGAERGPGRLVGPGRRHRLEGVDHGDGSPGRGDRRPRQAGRVAAAVVLLVVLRDSGEPRAEPLLERRGQLGSGVRVAPDNVPLAGVELAGLVEY